MVKTRAKRKTKRVRRKTIKIIRGGKRIASGTTAIVFSPPLKCAGIIEYNSLDYISKLTSKKNALADEQIRTRLKNIPDADKYAIYPLKICELDMSIQGQEDKTYLEKLTGPSKGYDTNIIMKNGGEIVRNIVQDISEMSPNSDYIRNEHKKYTRDYCKALFNALCNLKGFIVEMNKRGLYHNDIKDDNVVYNETDSIARLIDFGNSADKPLVLKSGYVYNDNKDYMDKILGPAFDAIKRLYPDLKINLEQCNIDIKGNSVRLNINDLKHNINGIQKQVNNIRGKINKISSK